MSEVAIGWWGLVLSLLLIAVTIAVSLSYKLRLERGLVVATLRAIGQLVLAGWALTLILDKDASAIYAWLWVGAMIPAAALSAKRRESRLPRLAVTTAIGYVLGLGVSLVTVFALDIMPLENRVLVPVAGMIVGNSLKVVVVAATRLVDVVTEQQGQIEAMLALGIDQRKALNRARIEALRLALLPQIETTRSVGIVFLPGVLTGLILAGVDPLDAALIQASVLFLILGSAAITGLVVVITGANQFITEDQRLVIPEL
ncbi:MAG: putative iron export permease protein FetB [Acidimicrobiales bacterium AG-410-I20]|nr:MAG: putative iron export permease protein FetB [Acidimicrobiales bacterium AG-410-I20]